MRFVLIWMLAVVWAGVAAAHEVRPAVGDLTANDGAVQLDLRLSAEAILAGVDLEGVQDTNETGLSAAVDALRALEPEALEARLEAAAGEFESAIGVSADGAALPMALTAVETDPVGDVALPRDTVMRFTGTLPQGAETLEVTWPARYGTLILRQIGVEDGFTGYLDGQGSGPISIGGGDAEGGWATFSDYIPVGFDHILPKGLDHILFVLGLFFLSTRLGPLLWQVTAFTLAHTVTLALGALGVVNIPGSIVEPIIAASIVYVAVENIVSDKLHRWRPLVIFVFGLLHGLGFAAVLGEFGLPQGQFIPALVGFNVGVELGQLTVIAFVFLVVWLAQRVDEGAADLRMAQIVYGAGALICVGLSFALNGPGFVAAMGAGAPVFLWPVAALCLLCILAVTFVDRIDAYRRFVAVPASAAIALVGAYWFVERVFL